jgi:hypothetical protein
MPEPDFSIKTGDTASSIYATLEDSTGAAVNIQGAAIVFKMGPISGGTLSVAGTATNAQNGAGTVDGSTGDVVYNWAAAPGTAGLYVSEWEVTFVSGAVQTFPNDGYNLVKVTDDL